MAASGNTHSQSGSNEGSHRIPPHPWLLNSAEVETRAQLAEEEAFMAMIEVELSNTK